MTRPGDPRMNLTENKAIVRRLWEEVWNKRDLSVADEIFNPEYARHEKSWLQEWCLSFPDTNFSIEDMVAEEDKVVTRFTVRATHQGTFMGIAGSGKPVAFTGIWIHRLEDGRIVEGQNWGTGDWLSLLQQMGAQIVPPQSNE